MTQAQGGERGGDYGVKVAIVGSRAWTDKDLVIDYVWRLPPDSLVVSGGAKGVDKFAAEGVSIRWQHRHDVRLMEILPDWEKHGKSAGFARNVDIVAEAEVVVAFWDGVSRGTAHSLSLGIQMGKPVEAWFSWQCMVSDPVALDYACELVLGKRTDAARG